MCIQSVAPVSAVPLIAWIYDGTGGFYWLFVLMAALAILALVGTWLLPDGDAPASRPRREAPAE